MLRRTLRTSAIAFVAAAALAAPLAAGIPLDIAYGVDQPISMQTEWSVTDDVSLDDLARGTSETRSGVSGPAFDLVIAQAVWHQDVAEALRTLPSADSSAARRDKADIF